MRKRRNYDTLLFAVAMITVSGACLAYNIRSAEETGVTFSAADLVYADNADSRKLICDAVAANLENAKAVEVSAVPVSDKQGAELLPPIVIPEL